MSLIDDFMDKCIMLNKITTADGYGGYITTWTDGAERSGARGRRDLFIYGHHKQGTHT